MKKQVPGSKFQVPKTKNKVHIIKSTIITLGINIAFVTAAFAAGGGGHAQQDYTWKDWQWLVINFAVLMFVLIFFGRKPAKEYFRKRTEMIEQSLQEAREAKELAQKTLEEVRARLKNTDQEIEQILEAARTSGAKEKEEIIAEGERLKEKIIEQAKANIDFELQKAKETIKSDAALLALELAEKRIKEKLGQKEQEELVDDYIKRLEEKN
jgi:F-type H+-transporting ATPase subunit b